MIHSILVLNSTGEVIIEKHYRGTTARPSQTSHPITSTPSGASLTLTRNNLTLLATVQTDTSPILITQFLQTLCETLTDYFGELNEHAIKDNFITVYELLDEMLDNGNPATLEPNALKELIHPPSMLNKVFETLGAEQSRVVNAPMNIPWRRGNVRHAQNEVFVDVTETVDMTLKQGLCRTRINGSVNVNSHLSGLPEITMRLAANMELDDMCFHHCIRARSLSNGVRFVPPDGRCEVMKYVIRNTRGINLPLDVGRRMSFEEGSGFVSVTLTPKLVAPMVRENKLQIANMVAGHVMRGGKTEDTVMYGVTVKIPFGEQVVGVSLSANYGTVSFSEGVCEWAIGGVGRGCVPSLVGNVTTKGVVRQPAVVVQFSVPGVAVSGMRVESLEISGERYKYYKGLKCVTKSGVYEVLG